MKNLSGDPEPRQQEVANVLEQVKREIEAEERYFDLIIEDEREFNLARVTMEDERILRLYKYIAKKVKRLSFMDDNNENISVVMHLKDMMAKLEDIDVVQDYLTPKQLTPEEQKQIDDTVALIQEKQKVKNMGPIRKLVYNYNKKRKGK